MQTITHEERKILELVFSQDEANIELAKTLQNIYNEVKTLQDLYSFFSVTNKE